MIGVIPINISVSDPAFPVAKLLENLSWKGVARPTIFSAVVSIGRPEHADIALHLWFHRCSILIARAYTFRYNHKIYDTHCLNNDGAFIESIDHSRAHATLASLVLIFDVGAIAAKGAVQ